MPYIKQEMREPIMDAVVKTAKKIANNADGVTGIANHYEREVKAIIKTLYTRMSSNVMLDDPQEVADAIYSTCENDVDCLGALNFAVTCLIQAVPFALYKKGKMKTELNYALYAITVGSIEVEVIGNDWIAKGIRGVLKDVVMEYKRRVNTGYEDYKTVENGDAYSTPYKAQVIEVVDDQGELVGYTTVSVDKPLDDVRLVVFRQRGAFVVEEPVKKKTKKVTEV